MRILHVTARYWPYIGGSERHLQEISERLVKDGHEVTVLTTDAYDLELFWAYGKKRVTTPVETHNGVTIRRFPVRQLPYPRLSFPGVRFGTTLISNVAKKTRLDLSPILWKLSQYAPRVPGLGRWLEEERENGKRYDVVMGMNICFEGLIHSAYRLARETGAGFVLTPLTHLGEDAKGGSDRVGRYYTMSHQLRLAAESDAVLCQTDIEIDFLRSHGVPADRLVRAGVGVNPKEVLGGSAERFYARYGAHFGQWTEGETPSGDSRPPFVFYVGTSAYDKGAFHLVEAMSRLWQKGEEADLVLAGPTLDGFRSFLASQPVQTQRRIHILGFIPEDDKRDLFAAGAIMAMPSRTDSFGIVYLEAWLYNKPVIGAIAGGVPAVIDEGVDGFLVRFGDVEGLADRLAELLGSPEKRAELGKNGQRKTLERYTWDRIYPTILAAYEGAARG